MFTWDWVCKHTVFFTLRASQAAQEDRQHRKTGSTGRQAAQGTGSTGRQAAQEDRQHRKTGSTGRQAAQEDRQQAAPEHIAQFVHMAHSFTTRAFCTICSQWHAAHSLRASCLP